jgi:hypothetical protein
MKKYLPHLLVALALVIVSGVGISFAWANGDSGPDSLITKLAERFDLNRNEVEQVFEENQRERQIQKQAHHQEALSQAVEDGRLTAEQKNLILEKKTEMRKETENLSRQERRENRASHRQEMRDWAEENNIDLSVVQGFGKGKDNGQRGFGHR